MGLEFGMEFPIDEREFASALGDALAKEVQTRLLKLKPALLFAAKFLVEQGIQTSPEWQSLLEVGTGENVTLREHFGLSDPAPVLARIVQAVKNGIVVETTSRQGSNLGSIVARILPGDYTEVLQVEGAEYVSQGRLRRGRINPRLIFRPNEAHPMTYVIPWLRWLLLEGSGLILTEAEINTKAMSRAASRTGRAIMMHPTQRASQGWRVPAAFAGTAEDNWLTRALATFQVGDKLIRLIENEMSKA